MWAFQQTNVKPESCVVNILPCRVHHNGPAKVTKRYWSPSTNKDSSRTSFFRGRKLRGRVLRVPDGYHGVVVKPTEKILPQAAADRKILGPRGFEYNAEEEDEDDEEPSEPTKIMETLSNFDQIVVWGHDQLRASDDTFVKGIEEWIGFAEAIHGQPTTTINLTSSADVNELSNGPASKRIS